MTSAAAFPHALTLWADGQRVATVGHEPMNDLWSLAYEPQWVNASQAFPLSPALPFQPAATGYAAGAVKRFVENLLPEGRALDITAATCRVSKSNVFALIHALGAETTGAFRVLAGGGGTAIHRRHATPGGEPRRTAPALGRA